MTGTALISSSATEESLPLPSTKTTGVATTLKSKSDDDVCHEGFERITIQSPSAFGLTCQICFEDIPSSVDAGLVHVTALCSADCPVVLCKACLQEHLRVAVDSTYPGILPRVRCPICLVLMNKSKWETYATQGTLDKYKASCERACSFLTPCCHNEKYTHLPVAFNENIRPQKYIQPAPLKLVPLLKSKIPALRQQVGRFANHSLSSSALIYYVELEFGKKMVDEHQHLLLEHLLPRILDEERRATLMMAYLAKHKLTKTRCCGASVCYNCKRELDWHYNEGVCDEEELTADDILECRMCRVTMVKVEGCNSVHCWCGYSLRWTEELRIRREYKRRLISVDMFDLDLFDEWKVRKYYLNKTLNGEMIPLLRSRRLNRLDQLIPRYKQPLQAMVQRFIWWRRFRNALPTFQDEVVQGSQDQEIKRQTRMALRRRGAVLMVLRAS